MKRIIFLILISMMLCGNATADAISDAEANAGAMASIDSHDNINSIDKKFVAPGITPIPGLNNFVIAPTRDSSFTSVKEILRFFVGKGTSMAITRGALKSMAKGGDVDTHLQIIRGENQVPRIKIEKENIAGNIERWFWIAIEKDGRPIDGLIKTGLIDGEADNGDSNSWQVIGKAALKALANGNTHMVITAEGYHRGTEASGWGIGLYTVTAEVSGSGESSQLGGGGLGYASNQASSEDKPWIKGYVGVKNMSCPEVIIKPAEQEYIETPVGKVPKYND